MNAGLSKQATLGDRLRSQGVSRRSFLKFCAAAASAMALPPAMIPRIAEALEHAKRPSVIWLSFKNLRVARIVDPRPQHQHRKLNF